MSDGDEANGEEGEGAAEGEGAWKGAVSQLAQKKKNRTYKRRGTIAAEENRSTHRCRYTGRYADRYADRYTDCCICCNGLETLARTDAATLSVTLPFH